MKGSTKHDVLQALQARMEASPEDEFQVALRQVYRIARFRLEGPDHIVIGQFASGWKRSYYGKGDVIVYRLNRTATPRQSPVFGANITILIYGDAFWPTYTTGDNTGLIATDSMKNFVQREMLNYEGADLEDCCRFLGAKFLDPYPQVEGAQMSAVEIPYAALPDSDIAFAPAGPECATARLELNRDGIVEIASGIRGFKLLRLGGSAFHGFVRDQYTTLPDITNRPLHMWLDLEWTVHGHRPPHSAPARSLAAVRAHCARSFSWVRVRKHPASDLSDRNEDAGGYSEHRRGAPGSQQSHLGHHRGTC